MATTFASRRLRLAFDLGSFEDVSDQFSGSAPNMWKGNGYRVEIGAFVSLGGSAPTSDDQVVDVTGSGWESLTMEVKLTAATVGNLMAKTVSIFDNTLTAESWTDLTKSHAVLEFTAEETNIAAGTYHLAVSVLTVDGEPITLGVSRLTVREDGAHMTVAAPPVNPGDAMTLAQADARFGGKFQMLAVGNNASVATEFGLAALTNWVAEYDPQNAFSAGVTTVPKTKTYRISAICEPDVDPEGMWMHQLWIMTATQGGFLVDQHKSGALLKGSVEMRLTQGEEVWAQVVGNGDTSGHQYWCHATMRLSVVEI